MSFTVGSDAEVLLKNKDNKYISAIGLIHGTKTNPRKTEHGYVQEDNVLAEFNVNPAHTEEEFIENTNLILSDLKSIIKPLDLSIDISATALFDDDQLSSFKAKEAGCDPDFDAWSLSVNDKPSLRDTNMRSCGGHLHIAFNFANDDMLNRAKLVRVMDFVAGVPSVLMDRDTARRSLYGKAGAHRFKAVNNGDPYDGVEYRSLSNFWLQSDELMGWAFRTAKLSVGNFKELSEIADSLSEDIVTTINNSDRAMAEKLISEYQLEVVSV